MVTAQDQLEKELKAAVSALNKGFLSLPNFNLPPVGEFFRIYEVRGITEEFYDKLNGTLVYGLPSSMEPAQRVIKRTGKVDTLPGGQVRREKFPVKRGTTPIRTPVQLGLPYKHKSDENDYVDFFNTKKGREFLYLINNKYLYEIPQAALVLSNRRLSNAYTELRVQTWEHGVVFLSIVPHRKREYTRARTICVGMISSFNKVIPRLFAQWVGHDVVPNPDLFPVELHDKVYQVLEGAQEVPDVVNPMSVAQQSDAGLLEDMPVDGPEVKTA